MCLIKLYSHSVTENNQLFTDVTRFEIDLEKKILRVYSLLGETKEFKGVNRVKWDENNDSLVIE